MLNSWDRPVATDILITGIPRSGTTLAAALIDGCPDTVCLSEPEHQLDLMRASGSASEFATNVVQDYARIRYILLAGGTTSDRRTSEGKAVSNYFSRESNGSPRLAIYSETEWSRHGLSGNFTLGMKHNALYTSILPELIALNHFLVLAIIRDPADAIASWLSLSLPVSLGRLPAAERYWGEMNELTEGSLALHDKQIFICELFCKRYLSSGPAIHLLRFEDFVRSPDLLYSAAGSSLRDPSSSIHLEGPIDRSALTATLRKRLYTLAQEGLIPSILNYYPQYMNDPDSEGSRYVAS